MKLLSHLFEVVAQARLIKAFGEGTDEVLDKGVPEGGVNAR